MCCLIVSFLNRYSYPITLCVCFLVNAPRWRIFCVPLRCIPLRCGTLPEGLTDSPRTDLRAETWPADTPVREKIYGAVENLQRYSSIRLSYREFLSERRRQRRRRQRRRRRSKLTSQTNCDVPGSAPCGLCGLQVPFLTC